VKYLHSNGLVLDVYDCALVMRVVPVALRVPLKHANDVVEDDTARKRLRELLASGHYRRTEI